MSQEEAEFFAATERERLERRGALDISLFVVPDPRPGVGFMVMGQFRLDVNSDWIWGPILGGLGRHGGSNN